jgi:8-oxo-dGTP diphosphatase
MKRSVAGISIRDGRYFVAKRIPGGAMGGRWEFPGGKVEAGETNEEALRREYYEEFKALIDVRMHICDVEFHHDGRAFVLSSYYIDLKTDESGFELCEHTEFRWASLDEILALDFADSDRKTLAFLI